MPSIEVDDEVIDRLEFGRRLTGWSYSEIIRRLALVRVNEAQQVISDMSDLAAGAPKTIPEVPTPQAKPEPVIKPKVEPEVDPFHGRTPNPRDLAEAIRAGFLVVGKPFSSTYQCVTVKYALLEDGGLEWEENSYTSAGNAMKAAYGKQIADAWGLIHDEAGRSLRNIARDWWAHKAGDIDEF
jgi:hypothetical protein